MTEYTYIHNQIFENALPIRTSKFFDAYQDLKESYDKIQKNQVTIKKENTKLIEENAELWKEFMKLKRQIQEMGNYKGDSPTCGQRFYKEALVNAARLIDELTIDTEYQSKLYAEFRAAYKKCTPGY